MEQSEVKEKKKRIDIWLVPKGTSLRLSREKQQKTWRKR